MEEDATSTRLICKVCVRQEARYTCPRCNLAYCSADCYKGHSGRCTESFYRDQATEQLKGTMASEEEKRHMMQVLWNLHMTAGSDSDSGEGSSGSDSDEEGSPSDPRDPLALLHRILSEETKLKLFLKLQQQGGALDIDVGDLTPEEYEAMRKLCLVDEEAAAPEADAATSSAPAGRQQHPNGGAHPPAPVAVPGPPQPGGWHPWWRLPEAAELQLNAHGQPLVADLSGGAGASASGRQLPAPPEAPLPALSSLTRAEPSPLLRWQLLQALYSYCLTERLLGGDWGASPPDAAEHVLLLAPALQPPAAAGSAAGVQAGGPADVRTTLMECCTRACQPPTGHPSQRGAALSACADVAWLLQLGRAPLLLALTDLGGRMAAGREHIRSAAVATAATKALARQLKAAGQKLHFFAAWANEQPGQLWESLAAAVAAEHAQLMQMQQHAPAGGVGVVAAGRTAHASAGVRAPAQPRIQPLPGGAGGVAPAGGAAGGAVPAAPAQQAAPSSLRLDELD